MWHNLYFPQDFSIPSLFDKLRTEIMINMGMSRWSVATIKSEVTNIVNLPVSSNSSKLIMFNTKINQIHFLFIKNKSCCQRWTM